MLASGTLLGAYEIIGLLGTGGMGEVYKARDTRLGRSVAVKVCNEEFSERFEREARAIATLNHPHICTLYDVGPNFLVMEYIDGVPLRGPLPIAQAFEYANQILDALEAAHGKGIVHRDLKPANILVTAQGIKLLDFGLATAALASGSIVGEDETRTAVATRPGIVVGTPNYMSPEQWQGKPADMRADIYSFGCVLYEMITGTRAARERTPLRQAALEGIVRRCLANDPDHRFQSTTEIKRAFSNALKRGRLRTAAVALILIAAIGILLWQQRSSVVPLTDQDVLVVADFENSTDERVFDTALKQALAFQLGQSPFLKAMDDVHVRQALVLSGKSPIERITGQIAHDICIREGEKATLEGSIARLGSTYLIALQAINCQSGETIAREQVEASTKEDVVRALGQATTSMRAKLGESLSTIQAENRPYENKVTTTSLEALQAFYLGDVEWAHSGNARAAISLYERATKLDPNFAFAWAVTGIMYGNIGEPARYKEYIAKAYGLIDRVSERERLFITAWYHDTNGNMEETLQNLEILTRTYPRDPIFHNNLANRFQRRGEWEKALTQAKLGMHHGPKIAQSYSIATNASMELNRPGDTKAIIDKAFAEGLDIPSLHVTRLYIAYVEDDLPTQKMEMAWFTGRPEEAIAFGQQANHAAALGHRKKASELLQKAVEFIQQRKAELNPGVLAGRRALIDALFGMCSKAAPKAPVPGVVVAVCGDVTATEKFVDQQSDTPGALASGPNAYVRGLALLRQGHAKEASVVFEEMTNRKTPNWGPEYPAAYVGLARAAMLAGDASKSKMAYEDFFALWKDADSDIPLLVAARKEYAALQ